MLNLTVNRFYEAKVSKSRVKSPNHWNIEFIDRETKVKLLRVYSIHIETVKQLRDVLTVCVDYVRVTKKLLYKDLNCEYLAKDVYSEIEARAEVNKVS